LATNTVDNCYQTEATNPTHRRPPQDAAIALHITRQSNLGKRKLAKNDVQARHKGPTEKNYILTVRGKDEEMKKEKDH
jgi:hypothetical protein